MLFRMHIGRDTLVFDHIREIPRRFPENDLALFAPQRNARFAHYGNGCGQGIEMGRNFQIASSDLRRESGRVIRSKTIT
jgi:hypothetical protein